jgi:outer membrane protein assembly factor BamB
MAEKLFLRGRTSALLIPALLIVAAPSAWAVSSKVTRQASAADLLKGRTENVVVGSRGTIQLGRAADAVVTEFGDVWSINSVVASGGTVYIGTSPNGGIYRYSLGELKKIYPEQCETEPDGSGESESDSEIPPGGECDEDPNAEDEAEGKEVDVEEYLSNEHIFAMATDGAGRLLAGISGDECRLCRFEAGNKIQTVFEPNDARYIFAIATDTAGNIYLGTGPEGKVYGLDAFGKGVRLVYDSQDKNILSLAVGQDGFVYAGSDGRGLVYKINPRTSTATVLYDSGEPEVTALLFSGVPFSEDGALYAAATAATIVRTQAQYAAQRPSAGRPETSPQKGQSADGSEGGLKLKIANTKQAPARKPPSGPPQARKGAKPGKASHIYRIDKDGYVTDVFSEAAVFFCLAERDKKLFVGTGNNGQLFTVDPVSEQQAVVYEDKQASQITAVAVSGEDAYLGTANPAKLMKLRSDFASEGTYISDLIDAGQPARWGKLQIDAEVPQGCTVLAASRSGNVKDVNDPTFSDWTELTEVTEPVQLRCPLGRFCQYKLVLRSKDGRKSPLIREIAVASTVPNLAPRIESLKVDRITAAGKAGVFKISYKAKDDNGDKLLYKIDFRRAGRTNWIELKDELGADNFEWNGKTVEDGRYEIRVTADDRPSNTTATKLTGSRMSDPVVVDNTGPVVRRHSIEKNGKAVTLRLQTADEFSAIGKLSYTVDSNAEWKGTLPDDMVYDTTDESFAVVIDDLETGEHVIAIRISDAVGNTTYKTFELNLP